MSSRKDLINHVRSSVKVVGERLTSCDADSFARKSKELIPAELVAALSPALACFDELTTKVKSLER